MASALSEALARKTNLEADKLVPKSRMGGMMAPDDDEAEATDPVEDAMSVLFPERDPVEAAAAFRRAYAACSSEESEPEAPTELTE